MKLQTSTVAAVAFTTALLLVSLPAGCTSTFLANQTAPINGTIEIVFINDTPYRASFTYGIFDALDRTAPGDVAMSQTRIEAGQNETPAPVFCTRSFAIGTSEFINRALQANADKDAGAAFDPDAFSTKVHFSSAPADSPLAAVPIVGTAQGVEKLAGVDYNCLDRLIFTFRQDPDAAGGFRIDYQVIQN